MLKNNIIIRYNSIEKIKNKLHKICYKEYGSNCVKYEILILCNYLLPLIITKGVIYFIRSLFIKIEKNV